MIVRQYEPADEQGWLRCRVLAFLRTSYFDDVVQSKPTFDGPAIELVAVDRGDVVGVIDVSIQGTASTIETIGVHPDYERRGIATALLDEALRQLPPEAESLDAWTRGDIAANGWYQRSGFREQFRYLHVYARDEEVEAAIERTRRELIPVAGFFHADASAEEEMRAVFRRVHVCRQYVRACRAGDGGPQPTTP